MPSIIDALVLELQLDASKFTEQQKKAVDSLRGLEDGARKHVKPVQKGFDDLATTFKEIQGRLLAIGAIIAAGLGFNRLVQDVTKATTELGYLSKTLGMTAQDLSAWENAGRTVGAATGEIANNMKAINAQIQEFHATGKSSLGAFMGQVGIQPLQENDTPASVAHRLSEWYVNQPNKAFAAHLLQSRGGLSQGMINMLSLGPQELDKRLAFAKQFAPTNDQIAQFTKLTDAFGKLLTVLEAVSRDAVLPMIGVMTKFLNLVTDFLSKIHGEANAPEHDATGEFSKSPLGQAAAPGGWLRKGYDWFLGRNLPSGNGGGPGDVVGTTPAPHQSGAASGAPGTSGPAPTAPASGSQPHAANENNLSGGAPSEAILQRARSVALRGGPAAVQSFMAANGYPRDGNWCGEFAAAVVRSVGGTPPKGAPVASNWRRWGEAVDTPGPGDIAVRRGVRTGSTGSHVTIVENYDPATGTFKGLGGNQGAWERRFDASQYDFRRSIVHKPATAVSVGPIGSGAESSFRNWQDLQSFGGSKGAVLRSGDSSTTNNSNTSTTNIHSMNVTVPPGANPSQYAEGISQRLVQFNNVAHANTGLV